MSVNNSRLILALWRVLTRKVCLNLLNPSPTLPKKWRKKAKKQSLPNFHTLFKSIFQGQMFQDSQCQQTRNRQYNGFFTRKRVNQVLLVKMIRTINYITLPAQVKSGKLSLKGILCHVKSTTKFVVETKFPNIPNIGGRD